MPVGGRSTTRRTYVVVCLRGAFGVALPPVVVGTVVAPDRATARAVGLSLALAREPDVAREGGVRVVRASACRPAWLLAALARDGSVQTGSARDARTDDPGSGQGRSGSAA